MNGESWPGYKACRHVNALVLLLALLTAACVPQVTVYRAAMDNEGTVTLYLQPLPQEAHLLTFNITEVSAIRPDGTFVPLRANGLQLHGTELVGVQKRLATAVLPAGLYAGLSLRVASATLLAEEGETRLLVPAEALVFPQEFTVLPRGVKALFLALSAERLLDEGYSFNPHFMLVVPGRQLPNLKGFVTNADANLVTVFNKKTMEVVDVIATERGPKGVVLDQRQGWLYVAMAGADAIGVIEVSTGLMLGRIKLNFGDEPGEMALSADGSTLVAADTGSSIVSIINTKTLAETGRVRLPSEPTAVIMGTSGATAYVLHALTNSLSVIDLSRGGLSATLALDETPVRGALGSQGISLYVITRFSGNLLVIDSRQLAVISRIFVGSGSESIKVDTATGLVYLGQRLGDIAVVDPTSLIFIDSFMAAGASRFLAIDGEENCLFVLVPERRELQKIDLVSKKVLGTIEVDEGSYAVAIMGGR